MKRLSDSCECNDAKIEIRDHFKATCKSTKLRKKLLSESDLTFDRLQEICRNEEASVRQAKSIENDQRKEVSVNFIKKQPAKVFYEKKASNLKKHQNKLSNFSKLCYRCGEQFSKGHLSNCKAFSKTRYACGTKGHLSTVCKLKPDSHLSKKIFIIRFNDSPPKMMKNAFYFILKALFVLKIFTFLSDFLVM